MNKKTATKILNESGHENIAHVSMKPGQFLEEHSHGWDVDLIILSGSLQINVNKNTKILVAGDRFKLEKNIIHSEYAGMEGVTFLSARPQK